MKKHFNTTGVLAIFAKSYEKNDDESYYDEVKEFCKKEEPRIMMFTAHK